jgi:hypothetical protein
MTELFVVRVNFVNNGQSWSTSFCVGLIVKYVRNVQFGIKWSCRSFSVVCLLSDRGWRLFFWLVDWALMTSNMVFAKSPSYSMCFFFVGMGQRGSLPVNTENTWWTANLHIFVQFYCIININWSSLTISEILHCMWTGFCSNIRVC